LGSVITALITKSLKSLHSGSVKINGKHNQKQPNNPKRKEGSNMRSVITALITIGVFVFSSTAVYATGDTTIKGTTTDATKASLNVTNSSDTSLLYVRNDGNVGVGTTTPGVKLDVAGDIKGNTVKGSSWGYTKNFTYTGSISTNSTTWVEITHYTTTVTTPALSNLIVTLHIPFVSNDIGDTRSRIRLVFDDNTISDATKYNYHTSEYHEITLTGLVQNVTAGSHTIRVYAAVDAGTLRMPHYNTAAIEATLSPAIFANLYLVGWY